MKLESYHWREENGAMTLNKESESFESVCLDFRNFPASRRQIHFRLMFCPDGRTFDCETQRSREFGECRSSATRRHLCIVTRKCPVVKSMLSPHDIARGVNMTSTSEYPLAQRTPALGAWLTLT
ncbi:hypothetical protein PM082_001525 [Marasmius tenuissimus]|nr:hypothetical protein PM082_001525 [Marasmius tenuissimus]